MMNRYYPITSGAKDDDGIPYIHVWVSYDKGDNYRRKRGYYLHASPVSIVKYDTYTTERGIPSNGGYYFLTEVSRASIKAETIANTMAETLVKDILDVCCQRNTLTVTMDYTIRP